MAIGCSTRVLDTTVSTSNTSPGSTGPTKAIMSQRHDAWREPRSTPDPWDASSVEAQTSLPQVGVYGFKPSMVQLLEQSGRFEVHELQGHVAVVLTAV